MANTTTLANLSPEIYKAADLVAREVAGGIRGATLNTSDDSGVNQAAYGDPIKSLATGEVSVGTSFTPAMTISAATDSTDTALSMTLDTVAKADFPLTGETVRRLNQTTGAESYRVDKFAQIFRAIINQIEIKLMNTIHLGARKAVGTAGTNPFASNFNILNTAYKEMVDAGAPIDGQWTAVFNTTAGQSLRNQQQLQKVNEAGDDSLLRKGALGELSSFLLRESAGIVDHTKGTATGFDLVAAEAVGSTTLECDGSDAGTVLEGDVVTFAADGNAYIINGSSTLSGSATGDIVLNGSGLDAALSLGAEGVLASNFTPNVFFHRNAVELAVRSADMGDDAAVETLMVTDPVTGIPFEFRRYAGEGMSKIQVVIYYGAKVWKSDFTGLLLG